LSFVFLHHVDLAQTTQYEINKGAGWNAVTHLEYLVSRVGTEPSVTVFKFDIHSIAAFKIKILLFVCPLSLEQVRYWE